MTNERSAVIDRIQTLHKTCIRTHAAALTLFLAPPPAHDLKLGLVREQSPPSTTWSGVPPPNNYRELHVPENSALWVKFKLF